MQEAEHTQNLEDMYPFFGCAMTFSCECSQRLKFHADDRHRGTRVINANTWLTSSLTGTFSFCVHKSIFFARAPSQKVQPAAAGRQGDKAESYHGRVGPPRQHGDHSGQQPDAEGLELHHRQPRPCPHGNGITNTLRMNIALSHHFSQ